MPIIIPPGYCQTVVNWSGQPFESGGGATVFGFGSDDGEPTISLSDINTLVSTAIADNVMPQMTTAITMASVYSATATSSLETPIGFQGERESASEVINVATLVKKNTAAKGPRGRGRSYWPGLVPEASVNEDGTFATPWFNTLAAAMVAFFNAVTVETAMVVLQSDEPGQVSPPLDPPPIVTSYAVQPKVATQRRRLRR